MSLLFSIFLTEFSELLYKRIIFFRKLLLFHYLFFIQVFFAIRQELLRDLGDEVNVFTSSSSFQLLRTYFSDLDKVVQELAKQLWYICSRCLEAVRGVEQGPTQLVTALRIIEREERFSFQNCCFHF